MNESTASDTILSILTRISLASKGFAPLAASVLVSMWPTTV